MNITSVIGNILVCLAVYKNPKLRSPTNLYIIALAASDLLCATVERPLVLAALITGRRIFGHAVRVQVSGLCCCIRCVLNSSNGGFIGIKQVHPNCQVKLLLTTKSFHRANLRFG